MKFTLTLHHVEEVPTYQGEQWQKVYIWSAPTVSVHAVIWSLHSISSPEEYLFMSLRSRRSGRSNPHPQCVIARSVATWQSPSRKIHNPYPYQYSKSIQSAITDYHAPTASPLVMTEWKMSLRSRRSGRSNPHPQYVIARSVATWQSPSQSLLLPNNAFSIFHWFRFGGISYRNNPIFRFLFFKIHLIKHLSHLAKHFSSQTKWPNDLAKHFNRLTKWPNDLAKHFTGLTKLPNDLAKHFTRLTKWPNDLAKHFTGQTKWPNGLSKLISE